MAENDEKKGTDEGGSIDYSESADKVDKAKQKARDEDSERLAQESE